MNSTPSHDEKEEITILVAPTNRQLQIRASLISRGLQDIAKSLQADPIQSAEEAARLYGLRKFAEGIAVCDSAIGIDPDFDVVLLQIKGTSFAMQGSVVEGLEFLDQALRINSEDANSWYLKSRLLKMATRTEERLVCLRRVTEIDPSDKKAWKESGYCLFELKRYEEAAQTFDSALRLDPFDEDCGLQKGIALAELSVDRTEDVNFMVVYDDNKGWHVTKEDDIEWQFGEPMTGGNVGDYRKLAMVPSSPITIPRKAR